MVEIDRGNYDNMLFMNFRLKTNKSSRMVEVFHYGNGDSGIEKIGETPAAETGHLSETVFSQMIKLDMSELKKVFDDSQSADLKEPSEFMRECLRYRSGDYYTYNTDFTGLAGISQQQDYTFIYEEKSKLNKQDEYSERLREQLEMVLENPFLTDKQRFQITDKIKQKFNKEEPNELSSDLNFDVLTKIQKLIKPKQAKKFAEQIKALQICVNNVEAIGDLETNPLNPQFSEIIEAKRQSLQEKSKESKNTANQARKTCAQNNLKALYCAAVCHQIKADIQFSFPRAYDFICKEKDKEIAAQKAKIDKNVNTSKLRMVKEAVVARQSKEDDAKFNLEANGVSLTSQEQAPLEKIGREVQQQKRVAEYKKTQEATKAQKVAAYKAKKGR